MDHQFSWREFKPAVFFILKFLGIYLAGNILYGIFITHFEPRPDPVTVWVTNQTADILNLITPPVTTVVNNIKPTVRVVQQNPIISVFEGCNGLNVMIVFLAFLIAYGPLNKQLVWFVPLGLLLIHLSNLLRISLLFFISRDYAHNLYFLHKYFFTAFIYAVTFALWFWWTRISKTKTHAKEA